MLNVESVPNNSDMLAWRVHAFSAAQRPSLPTAASRFLIASEAPMQAMARAQARARPGQLQVDDSYPFSTLKVWRDKIQTDISETPGGPEYRLRLLVEQARGGRAGAPVLRRVPGSCNPHGQGALCCSLCCTSAGNLQLGLH